MSNYPKNNKFIKINTPPFSFTNLYVFVGKKEVFNRIAKNKFKDKFIPITDKFVGATCYLDNSYVIYLESLDGSPKDYATLAHEVSHAVINIIDDANSKVNPHTAEFFCYLIDYYFTRICEEYFGTHKNRNNHNG